MKKITNLIIIDASSSMMSKTAEIKDGIKELMKGIRKDSKQNKDIKNRTIICQFASPENFKVLLNSSKRRKLKDKSIANNYQPSGMTALFDAIGQGFELVRENQDGVFVSILTDGEENCSQEYNRETVTNLISRSKEKGWGITFMGTTEGAIRNAQSWGVSKGNTMAFADSKDGMIQMSKIRDSARSVYYSIIKSDDTTTADNLIKKEDEADKD